jgi:hypothetical protein
MCELFMSFAPDRILTFLGGIAVGIVITALGRFLGGLLTHYWHNWKATKADQRTFERVEAEVPEVIASIREFLKTPKTRRHREFLVAEAKATLGMRRPSIVLVYRDFPDLKGALQILENHGYIADVTTGNVLKYRLKEHFVAMILTPAATHQGSRDRD